MWGDLSSFESMYLRCKVFEVGIRLYAETDKESERSMLERNVG
jgi:hypothetical protein